MSCNNQLQVYWSGTSFFSATAFFSDAALSSPSPDGFYAFGGFVREISNGILLAAVPCESCIIPCGDPFYFNGGSTGEYNIVFGMGVNPGAAIITFSPGLNNSTYFPVPDQCTWTYVSPSTPYGEIKRSEYSQLTGGYLKGLIGGFDSPTYASGNPCLSLQSPVGPLIKTGLGTVNSQSLGTIYDYNYASSIFNISNVNQPLGSIISPIGWTGIVNNTGDYQSTLLNWNCIDKSTSNCNCSTSISTCSTALGVPASPYNNNVALAPNLMPFSAGGNTQFQACGLSVKPAVMVVPSPPGIPQTDLKVSVVGPCTSTWWGIDVKCPELLAPILSSTQFGDLEDDQTPAGQLTKTPLADVCDYVVDTTFYHVPVDNWGNTNPNSYYYNGDSFSAAGVVPLGQPNGVLGLSDWIYEDPYGVTPVAVGVYKMQFDALDGGGVQNWAVQVGPREYKDVSNTGTPGQFNPLPPEDYVGQTWSPDWNAGITASDVQSTGARVPGIVRSITPCTAIPIAPCGGSFNGTNLSNGQYNIDMDAGAAKGAVIIRLKSFNVPDKCTWTYDGNSASEYSSPSEGYLQGAIGSIAGGGSPCPCAPNGQGFDSCLTSGVGGVDGTITNALGSNGITYDGLSHIWDPNIPAFVAGASIVMGPYTDQASGGVTLTQNAPGYAMMVVPKPNAAPSLVQIQLEGPCNNTGFECEAYCPVKLSVKNRGDVGGACKVYTTNFYTASPNVSTGLSPSNLEVHDWVFEDEDGVTPLPAGVYAAKWPTGPDKEMVVSVNGVITNLVNC